jgi:low affinity Fe/Cu permease
MPARAKEGTNMLMTLAIILIVLWALGLVTAYTMSGLIHILLVAAIIIVLVRLIQGRRVL